MKDKRDTKNSRPAVETDFNVKAGFIVSAYVRQNKDNSKFGNFTVSSSKCQIPDRSSRHKSQIFDVKVKDDDKNSEHRCQ